MRRSAFTLVELLVSLAIFSGLLLLMMQFFSGAQRVWNAAEQKNGLYADARVAMELCSTLLQTTFYAEGGVPFVIARDTAPNDFKDKLYFASQTKMNLKGNNEIRFVSFQRKDNKLFLNVWGDDQNSALFSYCFPPYDSAGTIKNLDDAIAEVKLALDAGRSQKIELLDNVTGFRVIPFKRDSLALAGTSIITANEMKQIPYLVEIQLTLMNKKNFELWQEIQAVNPTKANEFRQQHEYTFRRAIFIGDRWNSRVDD